MNKAIIVIILLIIMFFTSCTESVVTGGTAIPLDDNNAIPVLHGSDNDIFVANVNDDLTSQTEIAFIVRGHYKDD